MNGASPRTLPLWSDPEAPLPLATIILVTYNKIDLTLRCLDRLYDKSPEPFEVVVVDNASADDTVAKLRERNYPRLTLIESDQNLGFGPGCNVGARAARGEMLLFLNNDTLVPSGWLTRLIRKLQAHPWLGAIGPMTNVASNAQLLAPQHSTDPANTDSVNARLVAEEPDRVVLLRRLIGFCFVLPRRVWDEVGGFDERFGIGHYEDDDLSLQLEQHGYRVAAARDVYVHHFAGQSFKAANIDAWASIRHKAYLFYQKWGNAQLDWPDLRSNLCNAVHLIAPWRPGDPLARWRAGTVPFLLTCVHSGSAAAPAALQSLYETNELYDFHASIAARPLGEAFNVAIAASDAREHLILAELPDEARLAQLMTAVELARSERADAMVLANDRGAADGYFVTRDALAQLGPMRSTAEQFEASVADHAARARLAGLRVSNARFFAGNWTSDAAIASNGAGRGSAIRKLTAIGGMQLANLRGRWRSPSPIVRHHRDKTVNITMVSYNRLDFTQRAIAALHEHTAHPHRLVVVDNGSDAATVAWLKDAKKRALIDVLVLNEKNLGVAVAANQGWLACETDYYVKLDNDIVIEKSGWLDALVTAADRLPRAGMVGYSFELESYPLVDFAGVRARPRPVHLGGACVLIGPEAHRAAGYWCEDYFPYSEEDYDMGYRLELAGFRHYYLEDEAIGLHLPHGRATELNRWRSLDDEGDPSYRKFKDQARRKHVGTLSTMWINERLYQDGGKSLHATPGLSGETARGKLEKRVCGWLRGLVSRRAASVRA